jgi:hypothetical protein
MICTSQNAVAKSSAAAAWMPADSVHFFVLAGTHASPLPKKSNVLQLLRVLKELKTNFLATTTSSSILQSNEII